MIKDSFFNKGKKKSQISVDFNNEDFKTVSRIQTTTPCAQIGINQNKSIDR